VIFLRHRASHSAQRPPLMRDSSLSLSAS
jgi:hypothetical protein